MNPAIDFDPESYIQQQTGQHEFGYSVQLGPYRFIFFNPLYSESEAKELRNTIAFLSLSSQQYFYFRNIGTHTLKLRHWQQYYVNYFSDNAVTISIGDTLKKLIQSVVKKIGSILITLMVSVLFVTLIAAQHWIITIIIAIGFAYGCYETQSAEIDQSIFDSEQIKQLFSGKNKFQHWQAYKNKYDEMLSNPLLLLQQRRLTNNNQLQYSAANPYILASHDAIISLISQRLTRLEQLLMAMKNHWRHLFANQRQLFYFKQYYSKQLQNLQQHKCYLVETCLIRLQVSQLSGEHGDIIYFFYQQECDYLSQPVINLTLPTDAVLTSQQRRALQTIIQQHGNERQRDQLAQLQQNSQLTPQHGQPYSSLIAELNTQLTPLFAALANPTQQTLSQLKTLETYLDLLKSEQNQAANDCLLVLIETKRNELYQGFRQQLINLFTDNSDLSALAIKIRSIQLYYYLLTLKTDQQIIDSRIEKQLQKVLLRLLLSEKTMPDQHQRNKTILTALKRIIRCQQRHQVSRKALKALQAVGSITHQVTHACIEKLLRNSLMQLRLKKEIRLLRARLDNHRINPQFDLIIQSANSKRINLNILTVAEEAHKRFSVSGHQLLLHENFYRIFSAYKNNLSTVEQTKLDQANRLFRKTYLQSASSIATRFS